MGRKKGKAAKKAKIGQAYAVEEELKQAPHSFVFHRGQVGKNVRNLIYDMRQVMEPFTASTLKVKRNNVLKDFISVAGPLHVTHFVMFSKTDIACHMRLLRLPRGPTMTFKVKNYTLSRDIITSLKRHNMEAKQFQHHPLLVMNGFSGEGMHLKLMTTMFQNMFPSINVNKVKLASIKRCVLISYNQEEKTLDFRHFNIKAVPTGVSKGVKKLIKAKVPDMARFDDISEYLTKDGILSESEAEMDGPHNEVILPQNLSSRGNAKSSKSAIRLTEIGPRLTLQLVKIEEGVCDGQVLFHEFISKTQEELQIQKENRERKRQLKAQRKLRQAENVTKKQDEKDHQKEKSIEGMKKSGHVKPEDDSDIDEEGGDSGDGGKVESDDDAEYYKEEVGEAPDPELFLYAKRKKAASLKRKADNPTHSSAPKKRSNMKNPISKDDPKSPKRYGHKSEGKRGDDDSRVKRKSKKEMTPFEKLLKRKQEKKKLKLSGKKKKTKRRN